MSRAFNRGCARQTHGSFKGQLFNGIMFQSCPQKGYTGHWSTENGRAVIRRRGSYREPWELVVDGKQVGARFKQLTEMVAANEWAIRKVL